MNYFTNQTAKVVTFLSKIAMLVNIYEFLGFRGV
jgi:hypothetical protein